MLNEPEQRVGDDVVVEVVGELRRIDPADLKARPVTGLDHHRFAPGSQVELPFEAIANRRYPDGAGRLGQPGQPGHQSSGAPDEALALGGVRGEIDRGPVGGHDRVKVLEQPPGVLLDRQH